MGRQRMKLVASRDTDRIHLREPFKTTFEGKEWDGATDGHALLMMPAPCEYGLVDDSPPLGKVVPDKAKAALTFVFDRETLLDWCFGGERCGSCGGAGSTMEPEGAPYDMEAYCFGCAGSGFQGQHGRFADSAPIFNRRIMWRVLQAVPPGNVEVRTYGAKEAIRLDGDGGWIACVMPLFLDDTYKAAIFPTPPPPALSPADREVGR